MRKRILQVVAAIVVLLIVVMVGVGWWAQQKVAASLPLLDGEVQVTGVSGPATIERDGRGIATIRADKRTDVAFALGFVHAQDRFFQMDLLRRNSAGELAELVGPAVLEADRRVRVHRFRDVAQRLLSASETDELALLNAYAAGVNAGLAKLKAKPFEYLLLGIEPAPWKPEDSALVMFSMYLDLQGEDYRDEATLGLMHDILPEEVFDFLAPRGTEWDAPIDGEAFATPGIPGPEVFDTRKLDAVARAQLLPLGAPLPETPVHLGSNNWAVSGKRTADGRAMVADDMHLGIRVPHVWYRTSLVWRGNDGTGDEQHMTGVSLPGTPAIVVGSNGHVAWGFTNSEGDWVDVVIVEPDPNDKDSYLTPDGPRKFEHHTEVIHVAGSPDETLEVVTTIWGPLMDEDQEGRPRAQRWVAHDPAGVNMGLLKIESAKTLEEALRLANLSGSPAQNLVVADDQGRIAWTILGRIPRRVGFDGRLPSSWADGQHRWDGWLAPEEYPRVIDPEDGRLWTANARVVSGDMLATVGDGGYDLGARAQQIRDDLRAVDTATEADMLRIQLDDRAVFLERWRTLLLDLLSPEVIADNPQRGDLRKQVENWGGHAAVDSVGFRAVRTFRHRLVAQLSDVLVTPCKLADKNFAIAHLDRTEGPVWRLVSERPEHLIDPRFKSWDDLLLAAADAVIAEAQGGKSALDGYTIKSRATPQPGATLADYTWGNHNTTRIQHPLSLAVPSLAIWLDMPAQALPGDSENMPRIQAPAMGASQRMAVSPGHEQDGYMHMPCGQSGHPLSPHYRDEHEDWAEGKPEPFMPGAVVHTLMLKPAA
ncbi:MAG TPA: penicillin acylase family protein [Pirellulales bacterium]|jgi:penicillin amidase